MTRDDSCSTSAFERSASCECDVLPLSWMLLVVIYILSKQLGILSFPPNHMRCHTFSTFGPSQLKWDMSRTNQRDLALFYLLLSHSALW